MCLKIDSIAYALFGTQGKHCDVLIKKRQIYTAAPGGN